MAKGKRDSGRKFFNASLKTSPESSPEVFDAINKPISNKNNPTIKIGKIDKHLPLRLEDTKKKNSGTPR